MIDFLISILAFIVAISVLVAVHEYGHFIVGRWCGMKVLRFSVGFGKPIWMRIGKKDNTEYCISAIPLGGYVKFLGERYGNDDPIDPADEGRAFNQRPIWNRILVLLAGPFFNFLFAFFAYWVIFVNGVPTIRPAVGEVTPASYAAEAGLNNGDQIIRVGDQEATDWETALVTILDDLITYGRVSMDVADSSGQQRTTIIDVGDDATRLTEPGILFDGLGFQPWQPPAIVAAVSDGDAAAEAGIIEGDKITMIDGESIANFSDLQRIVSVRPGVEVAIELERRDQVMTINLTIGSNDNQGNVVGLLGVSGGGVPEEYWYLRQFGPLASIPASIDRTWQGMGFTLRMFGRMLTGEVSIKNISGPINIAQFAGSSASAGFNSFMRFLALVSISLGVINLLPIPILDGGQIVYQSIEGLKGSPLSEKAQMVGQQVGIVALLLLMSFAFYNDIARIVS
ncbi:MAG: RIP metalloprotease RseP [Woeseiaceae bacterium]|nr:RIP metalloprotease RseP [Woeseiaceae bacterium]